MTENPSRQTLEGIPQSRRLLQELEQVFREVESSTTDIFKKLEINTERNELVREIDEAILRATFSPQEVLDLIINRCLPKTGAQHGQLVLYRQNKLMVAASTEADRIGQELPLSGSLCGKAIIEGEPQHYPDVNMIPVDKYTRYHDDTNSELAVLIKPKLSNRVLGVLDLERTQAGLFDETSVGFAELLARQAAIAISHTQTWSGIKTLYEISNSLLSGEVSLESGYQRILDAILEEFDFEHGQILRLIGRDLIIIASSRKEDIGLRPGENSSICGRYLISEDGRDILVIPDIEKSRYAEFYLGLLKSAEGIPMRSEMIVPLIENNRVIGAVNIESPRVDIFSDLERNLLGLIRGLIANAISATLTRTTRMNQGRIEAASLALTQLGSVAQSFLHSFGNSIGDARAKLIELSGHLSQQRDVLPIRKDKISVKDFIGMVTGKLFEAKEILDDFSERFNPSHPRFQIQEMDMEKVAATALRRAKKRYVNLPIEFQFESRLPEESKKNVGSQSICRVSEQVYEVLGNILDNGVEAILERGPGYESGRIRVEIELPDPFRVILRIEDNGIGISEQVQPKVFEYSFSTRKETRGSHGIGLWFCDLYVKQRGGEISFKTTEGEGTVFEVLLPTVLADTGFQ
ncbi:MAG: two-component system, NtrC family, sensor kinase [Blastocatellia bacterium]|jgi:GAF domain-containing protein|nr:two-component system, NtrC family, sensor kinase [Blastocatellia bacterium]